MKNVIDNKKIQKIRNEIMCLIESNKTEQWLLKGKSNQSEVLNLYENLSNLLTRRYNSLPIDEREIR